MYEQNNSLSAKSGEIKLKSLISLRHVIASIFQLLAFVVIAGIIGLVLTLLLPLLGFLLSLLIALASAVILIINIVNLIIYCCTHSAITTTGIYGRDDYGKRFDLSFDQIDYIKVKRSRLTISANVITRKGRAKKKVYVLHMANAVEFEQQYRDR